MNKDFFVNEIPTLTWNWMKMNRDSVSVQTEVENIQPALNTVPEGVSVSFEENPSDVDFSKFGTAIGNNTNPRMADSRVTETTTCNDHTTPQSHEFTKLIDEVCNKKQVIRINGKIETPVIINISALKNSASSQLIIAEENSSSTVVFVYENPENDNKTVSQLIRTQVVAKANSNIHIAKVQLLNNQTLQLDDTAIVANENSKVHFTQIELGGSHVDSGLYVNLNGYQASFKANVAYLCQDNQYLDINHIVNHYGKKTESQMLVKGTVKDDAVKTYRGTIDFKKGCTGSKGNEMEETLLLSPKVVNKSLPVILCDEEDVEGEHGSSIGRISKEILFYMQTRGISQKQAEELLTIAKIQYAADLIPCEEINEQIQKRLSVLQSN